MAGKLDDKVCVITGGSLGIGSGTARECAREGGRVVILDIHVEGGNSTVAAIRESGGSATFIETDVSQATEVEAAVKRVVEEYGKIDVLVNAAALTGPGSRPARGDGVGVGHCDGHKSQRALLMLQVCDPGDAEKGRRCDSERFFVSRIAGERIFVCRTQ